MPLYPAKVQWHDLRIDPEDIPDDGEDVLVTKECLDGTRRVVANVYLKTLENDDYCWCTLVRNNTTGQMEETMVWEEIVAWAYYPAPHVVY